MVLVPTVPWAWAVRVMSPRRPVVVSAEETSWLRPERDVAPLGVEIDGDFGECRGAAGVPSRKIGAGVGDEGVGAVGAGFDAEVLHLLRVGEPEGELGVGEGEGGFLGVELEVQAGAGGLYVGEAGGWPGGLPGRWGRRGCGPWLGGGWTLGSTCRWQRWTRLTLGSVEGGWRGELH